MYKSFIRLHLDYDDIFDLAFNKSFHDNLEAIEYSASLARTAAIRGTSREKLYQEQSRRNAIQRISTRSSKSLSIFKKRILQFIRPSPSFNNTGIKHFTRLRLGLSHLRDQKFKLGFFDSLNPICCCELDIETTCHYLLHCPNIRNERSDLLNIVSTINKNNLKCALLLPNFSFMVMSC